MISICSRTTSAIHSNLTSPQALRRGNKYHTSLPLYIHTSRLPESPPSRPSPSWGRRNAPYIQTSIPLYIHNYPSSGLRPPSPARGEGKKPYLNTSKPPYLRTTPHPAFGHLLPQGAREKTLAAQLPSCLAAFNGGVHD